MTLLEAIAREEGFGVPNGRATRNNNPGDIEYGSFARANGATRIEITAPQVVPRFAYFPDTSTGFAAMKVLFLQHYRGMTVDQAMNKYAPPVENQTNSYIANICKWVGCQSTDIIDTLL
jgi:hypothetical protein